jgi:hypothetical protein
MCRTIFTTWIETLHIKFQFTKVQEQNRRNVIADETRIYQRKGLNEGRFQSCAVTSETFLYNQHF